MERKLITMKCGHVTRLVDRDKNPYCPVCDKAEAESERMKVIIDALINKGNAVSNVYKIRYDSVSRETIEWDDFIDSIMRKENG